MYAIDYLYNFSLCIYEVTIYCFYIYTYFSRDQVLNFEISECRSLLLAKLTALGYAVQEYLVSPFEAPIHIPNRRQRYYLIAQRLSSVDMVPPTPPLAHELPPLPPNTAAYLRLPGHVAPLRAFLDADEPSADLWVPEERLRSCPDFKFDIVTPDDFTSSTFTKAYGSHYVIGTGSFLQTVAVPDLDKANPDHLIAARVRYFSPREIARLQGFPVVETGVIDTDASRAVLTFPPLFATRDCFRLLGNSLNVKVVSYLLHVMCFHVGAATKPAECAASP